MTLDADVIVDRRRTRRKLAFWRIAAFVLVAIVLVGLAIAYSGGLGERSRSHVARVSVTGVIMEDRRLVDLFETLAADDRVAGVIIAIDSPGGSTTGGELLYDEIRRLAGEKPVAATMGSLAASAGYMTAIAADHIVARRTTITGSIGVLYQYPNIAGLLDNWGVEVNSIRSAPLKAEPSPFGPPAPGSEEAVQSVVDDTFAWFVDIVAERRGLPRPEVVRLADGRVYTGRQALDLGLVDAVGDEATAVAWLEDEREVAADLPVVDWSVDDVSDDGYGFAQSLSAAFFGSLRDEALALFAEVGIMPGSALDGLQSVWHGRSSSTDGFAGEGTR
jgi:protease-4